MRNKNWDKKELNQLYNVEGKTLQEIGDLHGVSRERARQVMEEFGLTRGHNHSKRMLAKGFYYETLEDYIKSTRERKDMVTATLRRFAKNLVCGECGRTKHLHIHHITYPATSLADIQILCASCHYTKHRRGMTYIKQLDIFNQYMKGKTTRALAKEYGVSRILIYKIIRKIRNGNGSIHGKNRFGRLSRQPKNAPI